MIKVNRGTMEAKGDDALLLAELTIIIKGLIQNDVLDEEMYQKVWKQANKSKEELREDAEKGLKEIEGKMEKISQLMELDKKNKKLEEKIEDGDFDEEELKKDMEEILEGLKNLL